MTKEQLRRGYIEALRGESKLRGEVERLEKKFDAIKNNFIKNEKSFNSGFSGLGIYEDLKKILEEE